MPVKPYPALRQACRACRKGFQDLRPLKAVVLIELKAASKEFGQNTIAAHIGISAAYLNDIIQEKRDINVKFLDKVNGSAILEAAR